METGFAGIGLSHLMPVQPLSISVGTQVLKTYFRPTIELCPPGGSRHQRTFVRLLYLLFSWGSTG